MLKLIVIVCCFFLFLFMYKLLDDREATLEEINVSLRNFLFLNQNRKHVLG